MKKVALIFCAGLLTACGQKGPLYLAPDTPPPPAHPVKTEQAKIDSGASNVPKLYPTTTKKQH